MRSFLLFLLVLALAGAVAASDDVARRRGAVRELAEKARGGDAKALYDLAMLHDMGYDSVPVDSARSTILYRMSAEKGYAPAQNYLGFRYFNGEFVDRDVDSALYWLAKAAGNGDVKAANNLGYLLMRGEGVKRDYRQAVKWLAVAADAGVPTGQSLLADVYREGLGVAPDTVRAVALYTHAIGGGLHDAAVKLLNMMGPVWESLPADSMLAIGRYYYTHGAPGIGVTLFRKAAEGNNADALALLGDAYSRAQGVGYDHDRSLAFFLDAALRGQPSAQFVLAELLDIFPDALTGDSPKGILSRFYPCDEIPADISTASYWYEKAAAQGIEDASSATAALLDPAD